MARDAKTVDVSVEEDQSNAVARRKAGEFVRGVSTARNWLDPAGEFAPEPDRYALIVSFNCPWCHRVTLTRALLGLEHSIRLNVAFPNRTDETHEIGPSLWQFAPEKVATGYGRTLPDCTTETATGKDLKVVKQVYEDSGISDQRSVPILYDCKLKRVVSNESADIVRMLGQFAHELGGHSSIDLFPPVLREQIESVNKWVYTDIANGAYKAGFSSDQRVYDAAYDRYFAALDRLESMLAQTEQKGPFLFGSLAPTEADIRLFPVLFRHDPVYYIRMKLNKTRIVESYPRLWRWTCAMYRWPGVAGASKLDHCKQGYFGRSWNNVVPKGPELYPEVYMQPDYCMRFQHGGKGRSSDGFAGAAVPFLAGVVCGVMLFKTLALR